MNIFLKIYQYLRPFKIILRVDCENSIDIHTSQHVYPANSFRDFSPEKSETGMGQRKGFLGGITWEVSHSDFHFYMSTSIQGVLKTNSDK